MPGKRKPPPSILDGKRDGELTEAQLSAPRIPRAPSTPDLVPGRDFYPLPGDPSWPELKPEPQSEPAPVAPARPRRGTFVLGREALPALVATGIGFGLGVAVAWAIGVI